MTTLEWVRAAALIGMDGIVMVAMFSAAALMVSRSGTAASLLAAASALRAGALGLNLLARWQNGQVIDWLVAEGLYDQVGWFFTAQGLVFSVASALQWVLVAAAVFVGRKAPSVSGGAGTASEVSGT